MMPLISVVIPVYRTEPFLEACVNSVTSQTYKNIEIILVDDGSVDRCPEICDMFAKRDPRIRVIHKENGGLSSARNAGIDMASGEYLAFLDSDDLWSPYFLEHLYAGLAKTDSDFAVCRFQRFQKLPIFSDTDMPQLRILSKFEAFECFWTNDNVNMVVACNKLYRKKLFDNIRYPIGKLHEDEAVIHEIIGASNKVVWLDEYLYFYRETPGSITSRFNLKRLDETYAKEQRIAYFEAQGLNDFANRTKISYLSNLIRLYRTLRKHEGKDDEYKKAALKLHGRFAELCTPDLLRIVSLKNKVKYKAFLYTPNVYSFLEGLRMRGKGSK